VPRCNTENTKPPEIRFHAVLGEGAQEVRFEQGRPQADELVFKLVGLNRTFAAFVVR
jgi:hypothetical protein